MTCPLRLDASRRCCKAISPCRRCGITIRAPSRNRKSPGIEKFRKDRRLRSAPVVGLSPTGPIIPCRAPRRARIGLQAFHLIDTGREACAAGRAEARDVRSIMVLSLVKPGGSRLGMARIVIARRQDFAVPGPTFFPPARPVLHARAALSDFRRQSGRTGLLIMTPGVF